MVRNNNKFPSLNFFAFEDFNLRWDVKYLTQKPLSSQFKIEKLKDCVFEESEQKSPNDEAIDKFKILGVSNKIGMFDAYIQDTSEINQSYKIVKNGFIAYNPYRINVGSIGLKTEENLNDLISKAYVVFSCRDKIVPDFLYLLFKTNTYNKIIRANTTGSVRQVLGFDTLSEMPIPVPSIEDQNKLVDNFKLSSLKLK